MPSICDVEIGPEHYLFTAMPANYKSMDRNEIEPFELEIVPQDEISKQMFDGVWGRMAMALEKFHKLAEDTGRAPFWVSWDPGKWNGQREPLDRQKFAAWCGPNLVGFLNLRPDYPSAFSKGDKVLYVEHIAASPGNLTTHLWLRRLEAVGSALMAFAVLQSALQGYGGRLGLHVAEAGAQEFYASLNRRRVTFYTPFKFGVAGTPQDRRAHERSYTETIPSGALELLEDYRNA